MFKAKLPLEVYEMLELKDADRDNLKLPKGYIGVKTGPESFNVFSFHDAKVIGQCKMIPYGLEISVEEMTSEGNMFWFKFVGMYPELDPWRTCYAIVSETDGLFRLESKLVEIPRDIWGDNEKYVNIVKAGDCYFVQFFIGHLHKELLTVNGMMPIFPNGNWGKNLGEKKLPLWGE